MLPLKTTRKALGLYGALLVLPTLVFGGLYYRELLKDYEEQLQEVPKSAEDGARRVVAAMRDRLEKLVESEDQRPFTDYSAYVHPQSAIGDEIVLQNSPLRSSRRPLGILAWFSYDATAGKDSPIDVFVGTDAFRAESGEEVFREIIEQYRKRPVDTETKLQSLRELDMLETHAVPLATVAVQLGYEEYRECLTKCSSYMADRLFTAGISPLRLEFYLDEEGRPRAIASRRVQSLSPLEELPTEATCLAPVIRGFGLRQGFVLDVSWLFRELPFEIASRVLVEDEELRLPPMALPFDDVDDVRATILPVPELGFEVAHPNEEDYGRLEVEIATARIHARFRDQSRKFLAVASMLVLTLATGMLLLYRSVNRELDQARRMQDFVAAVTHELRTPISTIRLHGEMLLEGWTSDPEKTNEYYRRIVRETRRLSTLVENVLEKSRLTEDVTEPQQCDLNAIIEDMKPDLENAEGSLNDLAFELAPNLPPVWLTPEGVVGTLTNLVENARKYAPVQAGAEPILVKTRFDGERVLLEVADRGPGVPDEEREHIFEAFYRVGSEATRTTIGTGLGLHLVRLHADVAGAKVSVHQRDGGGSIFRVAYRAAA